MNRQEIIILASIARANITCAGMVATNVRKDYLEMPPEYVIEDFELLIEREGLGFNQVISMLNK